MQALPGLEFEELTEHLPSDFELLRRDAAVEGKRFVERLYAEWQSGEQRFGGPYEVLLAVRLNGNLAGIGGMTIDPDRPSALRMRRFYVRPAYRRRGLGRELAQAILGRPLPAGIIVTVNTDSAEAAAFWEAIGFQYDPNTGSTHWLFWQGDGSRTARQVDGDFEPSEHHHRESQRVHLDGVDMALNEDATASAVPEAPSAKLHHWLIEPREYERQQQRRGRRFAFERIVPRQTALVVIDMIPFFVAESGYCRGIVPNIARLAETLRAASGLVSWVVPGALQPHPALAEEFYGKDIAELYRTSGGSGPVVGRIWSGLQPRPGDLLLEKSSYSAFFPGACDLPLMLRERAIDTVIITGTLTNICCESSARDAFASGFRVILAADGTAARRDQDHNASLHNIYRSFGDVRATDEIVELIRKLPDAASPI